MTSPIEPVPDAPAPDAPAPAEIAAVAGDLSSSDINRMAMLLYGVVQSALTTCVATLIGAWTLSAPGHSFVYNWLTSWGIAWITMLPIVLLASPAIRRAVEALVTAYVLRKRR